MIQFATASALSPAEAFSRALDPVEADLLVREHLETGPTSVEGVEPYFASPDGIEGGVAGYRVRLSEGSVEHVTVCVAHLVRLRTGFERLRSESARYGGKLAAVALAPRRLALLTTFPVDRRIPRLERQLDIRRVRSYLATAHRGPAPSVSECGSSWELASLRPEQRAVVRWSIELDHGNRPAQVEAYYLRAYAEPDRADRAWAAIWALESAGLPAPRPTLRPERLVFMESSVPGHTPELPDMPFVDLGALIARLHEAPIEADLPRLRPRWRLASAGRAVRCLRHLDGALWRRARAAWERLDARAPASGPGECMLHGDLHPAQVVCGDEISLVDFDRARLGAAADDIGTLAAHLTLVSPVHAREYLRRFRCGYEMHRPWPHPELVRWNLGLALLALSDMPFRRLDADWRMTTARLVDEVETLT